MAEPAATTHRPAVERTSGSAICRVLSTDAATDCITPPSVPATGDRGEGTGTVTRQLWTKPLLGMPVAKTCPGAMSKSCTSFCGQRDQEPNVVEMTAIRRRRPLPSAQLLS